MVKSNLPAPIQAVIDSTNQGNSEAFVAAFSPDGFINDWGHQYDGAKGIASWNQSDNIGKHSHFELVEAQQTSPGEWRVTLAVTGNGFNGQSPFTFKLAGDQVQSMVIAPD